MDMKNTTPKLCECGCGQPAPIAKKTDISSGRIKGEPVRFIRGHNARVYHGQIAFSSPVQERFESKIEKTSGCWIWRGTMHANGYGLFDMKVDEKWKKFWAHRVSYEFYKSPLKQGDTVDHLCFNPQCVNPAHLEAVPIGDNSRRSPRTLTGKNARKTHCPQGHPYTGENLYYDQGKRRCRQCTREKNRQAHAHRRAKNQGDAGQ